MANSPKGSGNPLLPIAIIGVVVVAIIAGVLAISEEEAPPDEPTVIAEDSVEGEPAGSGTLPEGEPAGMVENEGPIADETEEGITEQVDDVEPAADGVEAVPAADDVVTTGSDVEGETDADEQVSNTVDDTLDGAETSTETSDGVTPELLSTEATQAGGADGVQSEEPAAATLRVPDQPATEEFLIDEETVGTGDAENVDTPGPQDSTEPGVLPAGRDAQTNLDPEECQDIVRDSDTGGAAFIPTPSGPDANTREECLDTEEE
ncbi:hypothetical protein SAMN04488020_104277 [Palleronia marisminoris]|uniref:Uncharacterized protein n=1 Tax=Palleronia marisminoris TaxID=315423 RepID=A0A1Y5SL80_9RHOB|nr:hypothetical protein [Palleronia marisminoris]SFG88035.1 hypothetical protein SAMN04488020_104277 [Palleronia marisminoris]SLN43369.1 hypothetical protein PAM7066_01900 [Palleronia marisminoris]